MKNDQENLPVLAGQEKEDPFDAREEIRLLHDRIAELALENQTIKSVLAEIQGELNALKAKPAPGENPMIRDRADKRIRSLPNGNLSFGRYPQGPTGEVGPVEWRILDKKNGRTLVISEYGLAARPFNSGKGKATWETCSLRDWLNRDFFNDAFTSEEKSLIPSMTVPADPNPAYRTGAGNPTEDKVFLLSVTEAKKYFSSDSDRKCRPSPFTIAKYVLVYGGYCWWWLRSPGYNSSAAAEVRCDGEINTTGIDIASERYVVRPALWIDGEWQPSETDQDRACKNEIV